MQQDEIELINAGVLYVGNIPKEAKESDLIKIFAQHGELINFKLVRQLDDSIKYSSANPYAYVVYKDPEDAMKGLLDEGSLKFEDTELRVMPYTPKETHEKNLQNILVKNLPESCDTQKLFNSFSIFGPIYGCIVLKDSTGQSKGYGFIQFLNIEDSKKVVALSGSLEMGGYNLEMEIIEGIFNESEKIKSNLFFKEIDTKKIPEYEKLLLEHGKAVSIAFTKTNDVYTGFGFVNYENPLVSRNVIEQLHNKRILGWEKPFYICYAVQKEERMNQIQKKLKDLSIPPAETKNNLYITNIPSEMKVDDLKKIFREFGNIESVAMADAKGTLEGSKYAYILYKTHQEAARAIEKTNRMDLNGKSLNVSYFKSKKERESGAGNTTYSKGEFRKDTKKQISNVKKVENNIFNSLKSLSLLLKQYWIEADLKDENDFASAVTKEIMKKPQKDIDHILSNSEFLINSAKNILENIKNNKSSL